MTIIYESEIEVRIDTIRLNGEEGALRVFENDGSWEDSNEALVFENANAAYDLIDQFERALSEAGFRRSDEA